MVDLSGSILTFGEVWLADCATDYKTAPYVTQWASRWGFPVYFTLGLPDPVSVKSVGRFDSNTNLTFITFMVNKLSKTKVFNSSNQSYGTKANELLSQYALFCIVDIS